MIYSYGYLLMLLPPLPVRNRIAATASRVGAMRSPVPHHMLHMTLIELADLSERRPEIAEIMHVIVSGHQLRSCTFALGKLVAEPGIAKLETIGRRRELNTLRSNLAALLVEAGLSALWRKTFTPHVTLGRGLLSKQSLRIDPIFWHADQLALVESWRGETRYEILEIWPLLPPLQGSFDFDCAA